MSPTEHGCHEHHLRHVQADLPLDFSRTSVRCPSSSANLVKQPRDRRGLTSSPFQAYAARRQQAQRNAPPVLPGFQGRSQMNSETHCHGSTTRHEFTSNGRDEEEFLEILRRRRRKAFKSDFLPSPHISFDLLHVMIRPSAE